ncbi:hypothetical protein [Rhodococcus opacus]|uniref:hypothetical protein n=1 Tax=Rhodococcus opacus TaxID=37919 RepID=UPI0022366BB4|nr:hypothetical protein [Rhodococcus opacus]UZG55245.1 hypothetical protein ONE62_35320 [Rhodococcus opacus]
MTATATPGLADPLAPVRQTLLARARADADHTLAEADADAAAILARARSDADAIRAEARAQGESDAAAVLATHRARIRRRARAVVLAAQREAYDELRSRVVQAVVALRDDPAYGPWRDHLADHARAVLGADAVVSEPPDGGVCAETTGRRALYTLAGLAGSVLEALGSDVEGLWSS